VLAAMTEPKRLFAGPSAPAERCETVAEDLG
jgi:hypothetical protein